MVTVIIKHVVFAHSKLLLKLLKDLIELVGHYIDLAQKYFTIKFVVGSLGLYRYESSLVGISRSHTETVLIITELNYFYLISIAVW